MWRTVWRKNRKVVCYGAKEACVEENTTGSIAPGVEEGGGDEGIEMLSCGVVRQRSEAANLDWGCQSGWEGSSRKYEVFIVKEKVEELNRNVEYKVLFLPWIWGLGVVFCGLQGRRDGRDDRFSGRDYLIGGINGRDQWWTEEQIFSNSFYHSLFSFFFWGRFPNIFWGSIWVSSLGLDLV